jgi:uncharacterized protein YidB (DUF937 family)
MLDQLINSLKSEVGGQIMSQTNLPEGHLDQIFSVLGNATTREVTSHMLGGNLSDVMNLFSDKPNNSGADQLQSKISSGAISDLSSKLGLSPEVAQKIASVALPGIISLITRKNNTTPDDDPSPLREIFGGQWQGIGGAAEDLFGKFLK